MKPRRLLKTKQRAQRLNRHLADASIRAKNPRCLMAHDAFSRQKVRGITRRIKALQRWARRFKNNFPAQKELQAHLRYYNWKLPTLSLLVEGRHSSAQIKQQVARILLEACAHLIKGKPAWAKDYRVTCSVALPDMFSSEICIYLDEAYFKSHVEASENKYAESVVKVSRISVRSLANEWCLELPIDFAEIGVRIEDVALRAEDGFSGERWLYGEVLQHQPSREALSGSMAR